MEEEIKPKFSFETTFSDGSGDVSEKFENEF